MNIICIGAHPDDGEFYAGGTLVKWVRGGHQVLVVSMTNGDIGHFREQGPELARRRRAETQAAAALGGYGHRMMDSPDGELMPTLERRKEVVRLIREHHADLVLTHRPCDYHPDHRYTSQLVQDAAFMVTVPHFCPEAPVLRKNPVFAYMMDRFTRPYPFHPHIAVAVDDVMETKWDMLHAMTCQVYEWLPWLEHRLDEVPAGEQERKVWLRAFWTPFLRAPRVQGQEALERLYGPRAAEVQFTELFEICEYGQIPEEDELRSLFPLE